MTLACPGRIRGARPTSSGAGPWQRPSLLVGLVLLLLGATPVLGLDITFAPGSVELEEQQGAPAVPGDTLEPEQAEAGEPKREREFVVAPLPARNALLGWTIAVPVLWMYRPGFSQAGDRAWVTGGAAFYAENDSAGGGVFHRMSLGGDRWRVMAAAFTADLSYDYFGIGGAPDRGVPLKQEMDLVIGEALYGIGHSVYLGLQAMAAGTTTGVQIPADLPPPGFAPPELSLDLDLVTLSPKLVYDTRDNEFYPRDGWLLKGTMGIARTGLGSDVDYERHEWALNRYATVSQRGTLALRLAAQYVGGQAPFFLYPAFGSGSDLRGYQTGTYRDQFLFAAQAEWRQRLSSRWGAVVFAGIGTVAPELGRWDETLPSAGLGIRWVVAPKNNLSLRVDVAWGRGDSEFYLSIGEAF